MNELTDGSFILNFGHVFILYGRFGDVMKAAVQGKRKFLTENPDILQSFYINLGHVFGPLSRKEGMVIVRVKICNILSRHLSFKYADHAH